MIEPEKINQESPSIFQPNQPKRTLLGPINHPLLISFKGKISRFIPTHSLPIAPAPAQGSHRIQPAPLPAPRPPRLHGQLLRVPGAAQSTAVGAQLLLLGLRFWVKEKQGSIGPRVRSGQNQRYQFGAGELVTEFTTRTYSGWIGVFTEGRNLVSKSGGK